eukprot:764327-Prorocentrum_minimum.AAC.1
MQYTAVDLTEPRHWAEVDQVSGGDTLVTVGVTISSQWGDAFVTAAVARFSQRGDAFVTAG